MDSFWLQECRRTGKYCDVKVYSCLDDEEPFDAHLVILGARCPYFQQNFETTLPHIVVQGEIEKNILKILIDFMYHNNAQALGLTTVNVFDVYQGAKILMLNRVKNACIQFLDRMTISGQNCLKILTLGHSLKNKTLIESSSKALFKNFVKITDSTEFLKLDHELLQFIIKKGSDLSCPADDLLRETIRWIRHDSSRLDLAHDLLMSLPLKDIGQDGVIRMSDDGTDQCLKGQIFSTVLRVVMKTFATPASSPAPPSSPASPAPSSSSNRKVRMSNFPTISTPALISAMEAVQQSPKEHKVLQQQQTSHQQQKNRCLDNGENGVADDVVSNQNDGGKIQKISISLNGSVDKKPNLKNLRQKISQNGTTKRRKLNQKQFVHLMNVNNASPSYHGNHTNGSPFSCGSTKNGNFHGSDDGGDGGGLIYFIAAGPHDYTMCRLTSYNLNTKKYQALQNGSFGPWRDRCGLICHNDNIFVIGGKFADGRDAMEVLVYSLRAALFRKDAPQPLEPRSDFQCVVLQNHVYVVGGCCQADSLTKDDQNQYEDDIVNCVERLPPQIPDKTWSWEMVDFVNRSRADYGMVVFGGKIYVFGGYTPSGPRKTMGPSCSVESYDPATDRWTRCQPMPAAKFGHCAVTVTVTPNRPHLPIMPKPADGITNEDDLIYIIGGGESYAEGCLKFNHVDIYDPKKDKWTIGPSMMRGRQFGSAVFYKQSIYAIGGDSSDHPTIEKLCLDGYSAHQKNEAPEWVIVGNLKNTGQYGSVAFKP